MQYYVKEVLEESHPDTMIIHVGANNITKLQSLEKENTCRGEGVNKIILSALTIRPLKNFISKDTRSNVQSSRLFSS